MVAVADPLQNEKSIHATPVPPSFDAHTRQLSMLCGVGLNDFSPLGLRASNVTQLGEQNGLSPKLFIVAVLRVCFRL